MIYNILVSYKSMRKEDYAMKKKLICIASAAVLLFSGCSAKKDNKISGNIVAKVGDYQVTQSEFEFYLNAIKQQMVGTELSSEEDWQTAEIDGKKAIEVAKDRALESALYNAAYIKIYEKSGHTISDSDKEVIKSQKEQMVKQYDSQEENGYKNFLKENNITDSIVDAMYNSMYCSEILYNDFSLTASATDEEINNFYKEHYDQYFAQDEGKWCAKHVLILTQDSQTREPYPDDKKAEAKSKADDIYKRALAGENFDALISQYNEDPGMASSPDGYVFGAGEMVEEFEKCVDSLDFNKIGFTETSYGYHIIKRLPLNANSYASQIKSAILMEKFNDYIDAKIAEYGITIEETEGMKEVKLISDSANTQQTSITEPTDDQNQK